LFIATGDAIESPPPSSGQADCRSELMRRPLFVLALVLASAVAAAAANSDAPGGSASAAAQDVIPKSWLDKEIGVQEAEAQVGAQSENWRRLKALLQPGDRLWTFCSSFESFQALAGRCGVAIVRDGRAIAQVVTIMN
jgi:hypothetical protein